MALATGFAGAGLWLTEGRTRPDSPSFDAESRLIDRDSDLDVATFEITEEEVRRLGKSVLTGGQVAWPPLPPWPGRGVFFAGYPGVATRMRGHVIEYGVYALNTVATSVTDRLIACEFDRANWLDTRGLGLPPAGFDLSGISGSPLLTLVDSKRVLSWRLSGITFSGPRAGTEMILVRRADCLRQDGTLQRFVV